eukprot:3133714-Prymnesium_polylepis.3
MPPPSAILRQRRMRRRPCSLCRTASAKWSCGRTRCALTTSCASTTATIENPSSPAGVPLPFARRLNRPPRCGASRAPLGSHPRRASSSSPQRRRCDSLLVHERPRDDLEPRGCGAGALARPRWPRRRAAADALRCAAQTPD